MLIVNSRKKANDAQLTQINISILGFSTSDGSIPAKDRTEDRKAAPMTCQTFIEVRRLREILGRYEAKVWS